MQSKKKILKNRPAFSEEFEKAEEELQQLYGEYLAHIRCLVSLRAQINLNTKVAQPAATEKKSNTSASLVHLPDGILDFSDELSNDGDDLLEDEATELKLKRPSESINNGDQNQTEKIVDANTGRTKLRIKTGGELELVIQIQYTHKKVNHYVSMDYPECMTH